VIAIVAGLIRCGGSAPPRAASSSGLPSAADGIDAATAAPLAAYVFECDDQQRFVLFRVPRQPDAMDLVLGDRRQRLTHDRTGSGAQYTAEGISVWTKGREAMLEVAGRVTTCREDRRRSIIEDARVRGVEFRASGNEPAWVLELMADRMVFVGAYGTERLTTPRTGGAGASTPGGAVYSGAVEGHRLTVRVLPGPCFDTMSGQQSASNVEVDVDGKTYRGCGEALR
jgi:putative lipoprotein